MITGNDGIDESEDDTVDKAVRVERGNLYAFLEEDVLRAIVLPQLRLLLSATPKHPSSYPLLTKASSGSITVAAAAASVTARKDNLETLALVLSRIFDPAQPFYYPQEAAPVEDTATEGGSTTSSGIEATGGHGNGNGAEMSAEERELEWRP